MTTPSTISPLAMFKSLLPETRLIPSMEGELRYVFFQDSVAKAYNIVARDMILQHHLPLVIDLEKWEANGKVRYELVITHSPEPYTFQDEVTDDEIYIEEKAEWL